MPQVGEHLRGLGNWDHSCTQNQETKMFSLENRRNNKKLNEMICMESICIWIYSISFGPCYCPSWLKLWSRFHKLLSHDISTCVNELIEKRWYPIVQQNNSINFRRIQAVRGGAPTRETKSISNELALLSWLNLSIAPSREQHDHILSDALL